MLPAAGFALIGIGPANVVPLLFGAASRITGMSAGAGGAAVATPGYGGLLLAPPVRGYIAAQASIMVALGAVSLSGLVIALSAGIIKRQA